ncbi:MAG: polysaccharide deacetylase [Marinobacter sp.]|nr:polysaccharide deacetylase [Marinobacter sp.]|tara:strand:- start:3131 stop:4129 length:999 start_codon:yes stop_codon:yes gene_type:complete
MSLFSKVVRSAGPLGAYALARHLCKNQPRILMYHRFHSGNGIDGFFESQVRHIKNHYQPFSLVGLLAHIDKHGSVPKHAIVVTVDDGYRDFYQEAFPVLHKHGVPATLFATTGFIDGRLWLWPDKVSWILNHAEKIRENTKVGPVFMEASLIRQDIAGHYWQSLIDHALSIPDQEKHDLIHFLANALEVDLPEQAPDVYAPCSWSELWEMQSAGIEIGGHTVTHPTLGQVTPEQAHAEIVGCRDELNEHLGERARTFCYPNGQPSDFQDFLLSIVRESGFYGAVTAFPDAKGIRERFAMRRHACGDDDFQFQKAVSGIEYLGQKLRGNLQDV